MLESQEMTVAVVEWFREDRKLSNFMACAGLGLTGVGFNERHVLTYKPGEVVDEARVLAAVNKMIAQADEQNLPFKISRPRVVEIKTVKKS